MYPVDIMAGKKNHCIEVSNLALSGFASLIIKFSSDNENKMYLPGEKFSHENVKAVPDVEIVEVENKELRTKEERDAAEEREDENEQDSEDEYDEYEVAELKITMKLFNTTEELIREKLDAWVSVNSIKQITIMK